MNAALVARVARARAVLLDMDGTLVLGDSGSTGYTPLDGAAELLETLRARAIPFRIFTDGTLETPEGYAEALRSAGLAVHDDEVMTPASAAASWFVRQRIRRIRVLGLAGAQDPLRRAGLEIVAPAEAAAGVQAVFTAWYREFTFPDLEAACTDVWAGAAFTTASNVPFYATHGGPKIGTSFAINAMIQALTRRRARVLGKPSREAMKCALRSMQLPAAASTHTVVIGDDSGLDISMARAAGAVSVAVTTGLTAREAFLRAPPAERPDTIIASLRVLVELLGG